MTEPAPRLTYHLTPRAWWEAADPDAPLRAPTLATEGFIHCTDDAVEMVATANRHYSSDPGEFVILTIDLDRISSAWRVANPGGVYPHVFGPIDRPAILKVVPAPRDPNGGFLPFDACRRRPSGREIAGARQRRRRRQIRLLHSRAKAHPVRRSEHADPGDHVA